MGRPWGWGGGGALMKREEGSMKGRKEISSQLVPPPSTHWTFLCHTVWVEQLAISPKLIIKYDIIISNYNRNTVYVILELSMNMPCG